MTDLIFKDAEEARAWDMYVAGALASSKYDTVNNADYLILERRKRMTPEKKRETLFFGKPASELTEGELSALAASGIYP